MVDATTRREGPQHVAGDGLCMTRAARVQRLGPKGVPRRRWTAVARNQVVKKKDDIDTY